MRIAIATMLLLGACSSSSEGAGETSACADITGNWSVTSAFTSTDCTQQTTTGTASFGVQKQGDGTYLAIVPGVSGGCPGALDSATCKFTSACDVKGKDGGEIGSFNIEWTFSGKTLSGSEIARLFPPAVTATCTANYSDTGIKL